MSLQDDNGWQPAGYQNTTKFSATATSQNAAAPTNSTGDLIMGKIRVYSDNAAGGATKIFVDFKDNTAVASATLSMPLAIGLTEILRIPVGATFIAYRTDAGTADLYVTPGNGD